MDDRVEDPLSFGWSYLIGVGLVAFLICCIVVIAVWHRRQR